MLAAPSFDFKLHPKQAEVFFDPARFRVLVTGRRFGKTQGIMAAMLEAALRNRDHTVWYVAPTYKMAKRLMWEDLKRSIPPSFIKSKHETELVIHLKNGSQIALFGVDKPDALRGDSVNLLCLDEYQDFKSQDIFDKVLYPLLSDCRGKAMVCGTPKSFNLLHGMYMRGFDPRFRKEGWKSWQFVTADNPFIPPEEIEAAKRNLDPVSFNQEYMASFETMTGRVYYAFDRRIHSKDFLKFNPDLPIWIGQDFNIDPMSSVVIQPQPNGQLWIVDEIYSKNCSTHELSEMLERKFYRPDIKKKIEIYPDPAGATRGHTRGESDLDILRQMGFRKLLYKKKHPKVADRINAVNRMFLTAAGESRLYVSSHCSETIKSLEQTMYKPNTRDVDKAAGMEHMADALGYVIDFRYPVVKKQYFGVSR